MVSDAPAQQKKEGVQLKRHRRQAPAVPPPHELGISLSTTSGKLLQWLLRYPFQRAEDWALVMAVDRSTASRQIKQVEQLKLLESVNPSLGVDSCNLFYLNTAGLVTVARLEEADPVALARSWRADERGLLRLLPRLHGLVYLQNVINGLIARAPVALAPHGWQMEANWQWQRDYAHSFSYRHGAYRCTADASIVFHLHPMSRSWTEEQERWYSALLLLDTGLTGNHDEDLMRKRLEQFLCYRECEERGTVHRYFPPVLVLVQTPRQQEFWVRAAREAAEKLHLEPLAGAIAYVPREADIPSSWPLNWKSLAAAAPCRLEDLLRPMPPAALPPEAPANRGADKAGSANAARSRAVPLTGALASRARALPLEPQNRAAERETTALLGLYLERRHLDVLHAFYTWPLLAKTELAALLDLQEDSAERYLYKLRHSNCLEERDTKYGTRMYLSSRGLRLVAASLGVSVQHIAAPVSEEDFPHRGQRVRLIHDLDNYPHFFASAGATGSILSTNAGITVKMDEPLVGTQGDLNCITWRVREKESLTDAFSEDCELLAGNEGDVVADSEGQGELVQRYIRPLLRRLVDNPAAVRHTAGVYSFFAGLHTAARARGHQVRWWEIGSRCERRYRDHDSWHNLRPDAVMEYEAEGRRLRAWLEWDEGTMTRTNLEPKLEAYATYIRTREWNKEGMRTLPLLLVVAPYREQEQRVMQAVRDILGKAGLTICTTTAPRLLEFGALAPIWAQVAPSLQAPAKRRSLLDLNSSTK